MSAALQVSLTGIGAWLHGAPDWPSLRGILRGERGLAADAPARPAADVLPAAERRRAPDGVRLAAEVARQACAMAGADPASLACVFASTHGELAITDYVCETLARAPLELSPTKFHNSVLNAPAGYWTIATGCTASSSAVTAHHRSFAAGLLEATVLACAEATPVLFASCDVASMGPLAEMTRTTLAFGAAFVLVPDAAAGANLRLIPAARDPGAAQPPALAVRGVAGDNPANAHALALLATLARDKPARLVLPLSTGLSLEMEITP
ncbi:MAG TPA: beta-ketoacyl synthase chain length factor [Rhodanobacteraceae bacterium]|nr:beta-ketoacyl synthase chain length factor [Rhodanobacteraceae bacterium]